MAETESGVFLVLVIHVYRLLGNSTIPLLAKAEMEGMASEMTPICPKCEGPMNLVAVDQLSQVNVYHCPKDGQIVARSQ